MTQSIIRYLILMLFTWMVSKGVISQAQAEHALPVWVSVLSLVVLFAGTVAWSYFQKLYNGWLAKNSSVTPTLTQLPKDKSL